MQLSKPYEAIVNKTVLLSALLVAGCTFVKELIEDKTATPILHDTSASASPSIETISAPPQLVCDQNAEARKEVHVRHIHAEAFAKGHHPTKEATPEELLTAYKAIEVARQELVGGAPFQTVFRRYSDPQKAGPSGDLGFVRKGFLPSEFDRVVFCIPKGEISPVFRTGFGFHIAQVLDCPPLIWGLTHEPGGLL